MKKIYRSITSVVIFALLFTGLAMADTNHQIGITINDENVEFNDSLGYPFIDTNNRTLVPFRVTLEKFGATVSWDNANRIAIAEKDGIKVEVPIGQKYIKKDGKNVAIDTEAQVKDDGRTYLPIRAVLEAFGCTVGWNNETNTVVVTNDNRINFADENLELVIREIVKKSEGPIYPLDVKGIQGLNLRFRNIKSLAGIENLIDLKELNVAYNFIEDISPVKSLTNLQYFDFQFNCVSDISPLDELVSSGKFEFSGYGNNDTYNINEKVKSIEDLYYSDNGELGRNLALEMGKTILESDPNNIIINSMIGRDFTSKGYYQESLNYLENVIKNDTDNTYYKAWALFDAARDYYYLGDAEKAKSYLNEVISMNSTENSVKAAKDLLLKIK